MLPIIELGPWQVSSYQVMGALALTICGTWAFQRLLRLDHAPGVIMRGMFLVILGGLTGTYLITYLINTWRIANSGPLVHLEGNSIIWGLLVSIVIIIIYCRWQRISLGQVLDMCAIPVALGLSIGRIGCALAGCCYGNPTTSWLGMYLPDDHGVWEMRYPTQLMASAVNFLIFILLVIIERYRMKRTSDEQNWPFDGFLGLLGLFLYSLKRFGLAFLRQSGTFPLSGPFSWMHINALIGMGITAAIILWYLRQERIRS